MAAAVSTRSGSYRGGGATTPRALSLATPRHPSHGVGTPRTGSLRTTTLGRPDPGTGIGVADAPPEKSVLEDFEHDPIYKEFLPDNFNSTAFASLSLSTGSAVVTSKKLSDGIQLLERQLRSEVILRHDELLQQVTSLKDTESVLAVVRAGVDSLQASVQRVRAEIADPYRQIKGRTQQLEALHGTLELLRLITRVLKLIKKLREQMTVAAGGKIDLAKAAQLYNEIETLRKQGDLGGVDVVDAEVPWVQEVGRQIREEAMKSLEIGMESLNQAEVGSVLQVYYNMGELKTTVEALVTRARHQATKAISTALDIKAVNQGGGMHGGSGPGGIRGSTPLGSSGRAKDALWQRLQLCTEQLHQALLGVWHLQRVLAKKRDPVTHACFLNEVVGPNDASLTERVWDHVVRALGSHLKPAYTASSFLKETLVAGYPRLLAMVNALLDRLMRDTDVKGVLPVVRVSDREHLAAALDPFQTAYLAQSLSRASDAVSALFGASGTRATTPSGDQVAKLIGRLQEEVDAVRVDEKLTSLVVQKVVGKALLILAERAEYQIATGPETRQVTGGATQAQMRNISLCLHLQDMHTAVVQLAQGLQAESAEALGAALGALHGIAVDVVTPLFHAMQERIEGALLQMHEADFGTDHPVVTRGGCSPYMEETQKAILHIRHEFLSKLVPPPIPGIHHLSGPQDTLALSLTKKLASRVLLFFVRHAALLRPLSEAGKLRLAGDMAELESTLTQALCAVDALGAPYRALRALRPLIFLETEELASSHLLQDLPPSAVLHHLYSRAPLELQAPHARSKLSPAQYSMWLDHHNEEEAWRGIRATLDAYVATVKRRGDKEFSPVYPLMLALGQKLVEVPLGAGGADGAQAA